MRRMECAVSMVEGSKTNSRSKRGQRKGITDSKGEHDTGRAGMWEPDQEYL